MNFVQYVRSFYGPGGIYDMGATDAMIINCTVQYIQSGADYAGDSFDRENVRDLMIKQYSLVPV